MTPSAIAITGDKVHTPQGKKPYVLPRKRRDDRLPGVVAGCARIAANVKADGFDGLEAHGAKRLTAGRVPTQRREPPRRPLWRPAGEPRPPVLGVLAVVCELWGSGRVGRRLSPLNSYNSVIGSDPAGLAAWLGRRLNDYPLAYLHVMRGDFLGQPTAACWSPTCATPAPRLKTRLPR
jgi:N-ethylmaleimide reductase